MWAWAERTGKAIPAGARPPQPGDLIVWDEHIGIVESVGADGAIHTIEGNSSDSRRPPHLRVRRRRRGRLRAPRLTRTPRVLAVMVAYNEADVIGACIGALAEQGCDVYLIDHGSTDGTAEIAREWLGRGLVHVERFPEDSGFPARNANEMVGSTCCAAASRSSASTTTTGTSSTTPTSSASPRGPG